MLPLLWLYCSCHKLKTPTGHKGGSNLFKFNLKQGNHKMCGKSLPSEHKTLMKNRLAKNIFQKGGFERDVTGFFIKM